jgi:hypothetical protein
MGSGTYEFRKWSLILRFDTGYVQAIHARFDADDPAAAKDLFLNGYTFERTGAAAAPPAGGTAIHGLLVPVPKEWMRKDDPSGAVYLVPPQIPGVLQYLLAVLPANKLQGSHWETHKATLKAMAQQAQLAGEPVPTHTAKGPGIFIKSETTGKTAAGELRTFALFTAVHDGIMEAIVGVNNLDRNVVDPVLEAITFKEPPKSEARPKIVEAYRRMNQQLYINPNGGAMIAGNLQYDRLWLWSNGVADYSTFYTEGYAASTLPSKVDLDLMNGDFGRWKEVDGKIHVLRTAGGAAEVFDRATGPAGWETMLRVDGLKLSGRWETAGDWIEFTPEGTFKVSGVLKTVAFGDVSKVRPPDKGAGSYVIRDWTIFFKFDDGTAWSTDFSILGREMKNDASILFRTRAYPKAK